MEMKITNNLILTTDSPASSYGVGALRHLDCDCGDMGPGDAVPNCLQDGRGELNMAAFVWRMIQEEGTADDTPESRQALTRWLAQPPGDPQDWQMVNAGS